MRGAALVRGVVLKKKIAKLVFGPYDTIVSHGDGILASFPIDNERPKSAVSNQISLNRTIKACNNLTGVPSRCQYYYEF